MKKAIDPAELNESELSVVGFFPGLRSRSGTAYFERIRKLREADLLKRLTSPNQPYAKICLDFMPPKPGEHDDGEENEGNPTSRKEFFSVVINAKESTDRSGINYFAAIDRVWDKVQRHSTSDERDDIVTVDFPSTLREGYSSQSHGFRDEPVDLLEDPTVAEGAKSAAVGKDMNKLEDSFIREIKEMEKQQKAISEATATGPVEPVEEPGSLRLGAFFGGRGGWVTSISQGWAFIPNLNSESVALGSEGKKKKRRRKPVDLSTRLTYIDAVERLSIKLAKPEYLDHLVLFIESMAFEVSRLEDLASGGSGLVNADYLERAKLSVFGILPTPQVFRWDSLAVSKSTLKGSVGNGLSVKRSDFCIGSGVKYIRPTSDGSTSWDDFYSAIMNIFFDGCGHTFRQTFTHIVMQLPDEKWDENGEIIDSARPFFVLSKDELIEHMRAEFSSFCLFNTRRKKIEFNDLGAAVKGLRSVYRAQKLYLSEYEPITIKSCFKKSKYDVPVPSRMKIENRGKKKIVVPAKPAYFVRDLVTTYGPLDVLVEDLFVLTAGNLDLILPTEESLLLEIKYRLLAMWALAEAVRLNFRDTSPEKFNSLLQMVLQFTREVFADVSDGKRRHILLRILLRRLAPFVGDSELTQIVSELVSSCRRLHPQFKTFLQSHNRNVLACQRLLDSDLGFQSKHWRWSPQCYRARITSDLRLQRFLQLRREVENKVCEVVRRLRYRLLETEDDYFVSIASDGSGMRTVPVGRLDKFRFPTEPKTRRHWALDESSKTFESSLSSNIAANPVGSSMPRLSNPRPISAVEAWLWSFFQSREFFFTHRLLLSQEAVVTVRVNFSEAKVYLFCSEFKSTIEEYLDVPKSLLLPGEDSLGEICIQLKEWTDEKEGGGGGGLRLRTAKDKESQQKDKESPEVCDDLPLGVVVKKKYLSRGAIPFERWTFPVYSARLDSDHLLKDSLKLRDELEQSIYRILGILGSSEGGDDISRIPYLQVESRNIRTKSHYRKTRYVKRIAQDVSSSAGSEVSKRKWVVAEGESAIDRSVTSVPTPSGPALINSTTVIYPWVALQWAFCHSQSKFFSDTIRFRMTDICDVNFDFDSGTAEVRVKRDSNISTAKLPLSRALIEATGVRNKNKTFRVELIDSEAYFEIIRKKTSMLSLHTALAFKADDETIFNLIDKNPGCVAVFDLKSQLPLYIALDAGASREVLARLLILSLPYTRDGKFVDFPNGAAHWIYFLTETNDRYADVVEMVLNEFHLASEDNSEAVERVRILAELKDSSDRKAIDVATPACKKAILTSMLFFGRYEFKTRHAEHKSATCILYLAEDHTNNQAVALKLMKFKDQYLRELQSRQESNFSPDSVLGILTEHDGDVETKFAQEMSQKGYPDYKYCIVLPFAERNLSTILAHEHIAGKDWKKIRQLCEEMVESIQHIHSKGLIHGDIKPLNIVRQDQRLKLIDLDACASCDGGFSGSKFSSAFLPPEMIYCYTDDEGKAMASPKTFKVDLSTNLPIQEGLPYSLVPARTAHDVWALGVTLFQMFTGEALFLSNDEDNIDVKSMLTLSEWSEDFKAEKLAKVADVKARNLLGQLLAKDWSKRPNTTQILNHPFITMKEPARMVGQKAEYDVFVSYRVAADAHHVEKLYDLLTEMNIKVWWDKKCLLPGEPWEIGFCNGLVKSLAFVPLLSRAAINNPSKDYQNFDKLTETSRCDNVFLEHRLALELRTLGLVQKIFPVLIGDLDEQSGVYGSYSAAKCGPVGPKVVVKSVEEKLREHLDRQGLGASMSSYVSVNAVLGGLMENQGGFIRGAKEEAFTAIAQTIADMVRSARAVETRDASGGNERRNAEAHGSSAGNDSTNSQLVSQYRDMLGSLKYQNTRLKSRVSELEDYLEQLEAQRATAQDRSGAGAAATAVVTDTPSSDGCEGLIQEKPVEKPAARTAPNRVLPVEGEEFPSVLKTKSGRLRRMQSSDSMRGECNVQ